MDPQITKKFKTTFNTTVPAKWVFAGEHSVIRGATALCFPTWAYTMTLEFSEEAPVSKLHTPSSDIFELLEEGFSYCGIQMADLNLQGKVLIESSIPMGGGLGSSAALCVCLARFILFCVQRDALIQDSLITETKLATHLEHHFHGTSSGMDVHVISLQSPILYSRELGCVEVLNVEDAPEFLKNIKFLDSGLRGRTKDCIEQVNAWRQQVGTEVANQMDRRMHQAAMNGAIAIKNKSHSLWIESMELAQSCIEAWGLVPDSIQSQKSRLIESGARSVKLTGAGLGGFWVY
jgi:mevalonate kinase